MVKNERSGWRDIELSKRHRTWGEPLAATDIDWLEYYKHEPVALIETKCQQPKNRITEYLKGANKEATQKQADRAKQPFFLVNRANDFSWFYVMPLNEYARNFLPKTDKMSEMDYVALLYKIRGLKIPNRIKNEINKVEDENEPNGLADFM